MLTVKLILIKNNSQNNLGIIEVRIIEYCHVKDRNVEIRERESYHPG